MDNLLIKFMDKVDQQHLIDFKAECANTYINKTDLDKIYNHILPSVDTMKQMHYESNENFSKILKLVSENDDKLLLKATKIDFEILLNNLDLIKKDISKIRLDYSNEKLQY